MKTTDSVRLNGWVIQNKGWLSSSERGTLAEAATKAADALGCKVSAHNLAELMRMNEIETRRMSAHQSERLVLLGENEKLRAENMQIRRVLAKIYASSHIPDDLKDYCFAGLDEETRTAIFSH